MLTADRAKIIRDASEWVDVITSREVFKSARKGESKCSVEMPAHLGDKLVLTIALTLQELGYQVTCNMNPSNNMGYFGYRLDIGWK